MPKLAVAANLTYLHPSVVLEFSDDLPDFHRFKLLTGCIRSFGRYICAPGRR